MCPASIGGGASGSGWSIRRRPRALIASVHAGAGSPLWVMRSGRGPSNVGDVRVLGLLFPILTMGCYGSYGLDGSGGSDRRGVDSGVGLGREGGVGRHDGGGASRRDGGSGSRDGGTTLRDLGPGARPDGPTETPPLATPYEACIELSRLVCYGQVYCCPDGGGPGTDPSVCEDDRGLGCDWFLMDERWTDGTIRYDSVDARNLWRSFANALATCGEVDTRWTDKTGIFRGTLPEGADCQRGDPFINYLSCEPGTRCVWLNATEGVCGALGEEGDRCSISLECNTGLFCDSEVPGSDHAQCMPIQALREPCSVGSGCTSQRCEDEICVEPTGPESWCPPTGR